MTARTLSTKNMFEDMQWSGLIQDATPNAEAMLQEQRVTGYIGIDPTADSLHVGHLMVIKPLEMLQRCGHRPIAVVGGATGLIGDPSGKAAERTLLTAEQVAHNLAGIQAQLANFFDFGTGGLASEQQALIVDNAEWFRNMSVLEFLRDVGKHFPVSQMLARESVNKRMAREDALSFTEFAYQPMQAYDFLVLNRRYGCTLQMGGSDQWGNITAGIDLIRRVTGQRVAGIVFPLLTNGDGTKFGKSEAGTIWLDARRTSPFQFYQFWFNVDDGDVIRYLKLFTWLDRAEVAELAEGVQSAPERREAQRVLAREMTSKVHGASALARAERAAAALFNGDLSELDERTLGEVFQDAPSRPLPQAMLVEGCALPDLLVHSGLAASRGEARRLVVGGGVYLNNRRVVDPGWQLERSDALAGGMFVIRRGRRDHVLLQLTSE